MEIARKTEDMLKGTPRSIARVMMVGRIIEPIVWWKKWFRRFFASPFLIKFSSISRLFSMRSAKIVCHAYNLRILMFLKAC